MNKFVLIFIICVNLFPVLTFEAFQCLISNNNDRIDCFPQPNVNEAECVARGCCWSEPIHHDKLLGDSLVSIPYCYYPTNYPNYMFKAIKRSRRGIRGKLIKQEKSFVPNEILSLDFEVIYETNTRVRIRITDSKHLRYEVPVKLTPPDPISPTDPNYEVIVDPLQSFSLVIKRKSDQISLFKTFGPLIYSDQFIQITSKMSTDQLYGMGEQNRPFLHQLSNGWSTIGLWARDNPIDTFINLYGTHPFYMAMPENGKAFGVYYFNSNAQEFVLQPSPAVTYRTIGGILDIFIFTGGTPESTVQQYTELVGRPMLPPHWALGFHLSRYGYKNVNEMSETIERNINAGVPIDIQWSDIDYMDKYKDFTVDNSNYQELSTYIKFLREKYNIKYVSIIDAAIKCDEKNSYGAYLDGITMNIFIRDYLTRKPLIGNVWPGETVFPDFTHPNISKYWIKQIYQFHHSIPVDGLWIDMNEPSSFYDGSKSGCKGNNQYDHPFYVPMIRDHSLIAKTICSSALHYNEIPHYNLHNIYGYSESVITNTALSTIIPNKRPFILSRSTFSGSGKYTFHWTGDNFSNWNQLKNSIRQILNFNMFGIPMTGADICGFVDASNEELCIRWMQLGAFYPFMRNHNTINVRNQDPASWSVTAVKIMRDAINIRYSLLPNIYSLLVKSHLYGGTVMRPMSFEFFEDKTTHSLDLQFMIGSSIMVIPTVFEGKTSVAGYFPAGIWYDLNNGSELFSSTHGSWLNLDSPLDKINVVLKGGSIITLMNPEHRTTLSEESEITLLCAMSKDQEAFGDLYWDDGKSIDTYIANKYNYLTFVANEDGLMISVNKSGYNKSPSLKNIVIIGLKGRYIRRVIMNNKELRFVFDSKKAILNIPMDGLKLVFNIDIKWF